MILRTVDSPDANARTPESGETRWALTIPLENGDTLTLYLGKKSRDTIFGMMIADCQDSNEPEPA